MPQPLAPAIIIIINIYHRRLAAQFGSPLTLSLSRKLLLNFAWRWLTVSGEGGAKVAQFAGSREAEEEEATRQTEDARRKTQDKRKHCAMAAP